MALSLQKLEDMQEEKSEQLKKFLAMEPPQANGDSLLAAWEEVYDEKMRSIVVETVTGPSDDATNPVYPYEKLQALVGDGGNWKWPRMWQRLDEIERRGPAYRQGEEFNFGMPNKNPNIVPQRICLVGGGPIGLRLAIELAMGGHKVTQFEKRREVRKDGEVEVLGFTNRINRPHMWPFVRNDLGKLNGKDFLSRQAAYPVFTEPETSSIGIDELQILLLKNALLLGVDFRLGVSYEDAKVGNDPKTMRPFWKVACDADAQAAKKYGMEEGKQTVQFDVLIGCDGPRTQVRATQGKHFGEIQKRKFMDCIGIVANVRKVTRKRLKEIGFEYGQEPNDMNRTTMVFREFFGKIKAEANAELENLIYYKASFHNYCILTPKRANLSEHGLGGPVYHFAAARSAPGKSEEKQKLKDYCAKVLKAAGIPIDEQLPNEGFVDPPNDVMAFDFAECWNTPKSMAFNLPPGDYDVDVHGEWMGRRLIPLVALAGDALLEPFWPMGLGLKRGWQALMDTCYAIDNLYNKDLFCEKKGKDPSSWTWDDHFEALQEQVAANFEFCNRLKISDELGKGAYADNGPVITQLKKKNKDAEIPNLEVEIDPWQRYAALEKESGDAWKTKLKDPEWVHPIVQKVLNKEESYKKTGKSKTGDFSYTGKKLISVDGKVPGGKPSAAAAGKPAEKPAPTETFTKRQSLNKPAPTLASIAAASKGEIAEKVAESAERLKTETVEKGMESHLENKRQENNAPENMKRAPSRRSTADDAKSVADAIQKANAESMIKIKPHLGEAEAANDSWSRIMGSHMSPAQKAELARIRYMIDAYESSLKSFREAEQKILRGE